MGSVFPSNTIPKSVIYGGAGTTSVYYSLSADEYKYEFVDENNRETSDIEVRLASDTNNTGPYDLLVRSDPTRKVTNFGFPTGERDASGEMIFQIIAAESICLAEGTKITIYNPDKKCLDQVNVENLKEGDEVLTYKHGLVKVFSMVEDQFMHNAPCLKRLKSIMLVHRLNLSACLGYRSPMWGLLERCSK